ncbi:carboxypeptidase regulatory-like domain-containing protein [Myxococcus xanthus]|uniref:Carboxypeptidase regulatory-like domain-containing protein n=1 Tax=Myxococcus xanthus TaxID=34 RepID=A0A7Y4IGG2_MYXXA|nr:carboxypeptidase regulatory-like domain-containing protein [Myxococcus xanthus]NOJ78709.1 carboxypeptidase regulatory-like domain-containing protein [Myxococcus xanthus]NOJ84148.1 carboxypeptidase regulatory-like domain-containing protein [Myxococcus xanthus]
MKRRAWGVGGAALVLAALVLWWLWPADVAAPVTPARAPVVRTEAPTPVSPPPPVELEPPHSEGLVLRVVLQGDVPFQGEARVGEASISDADRHVWEVSKREGRQGAGPVRLEDLANVLEWRPVEVTPSATGGTLGPVLVPVVPLYRVVAWAADGTFWLGDVVLEEGGTTGVVEAVLPARAPTGVRVRLTGVRPEHGPFSLRVVRGVSRDVRDAERASELLPVIRHVAPDIASALADGTALPLPVGKSLELLPLPTDPAVGLVLRSAAGRESAWVEVPLREGRVEPVVLDVGSLFPEGVGEAVTLRGTVELEGTFRPPEGARLLGPGDVEIPLAQDGRFVASRLPSWEPSRFRVEVASPVSRRPVTATEQAFDFRPEPGVRDAEVTWRVKAYRWLVLRMDAAMRAQIEARTRKPYPVFVLQRWHHEKQWELASAGAYIQEEDGMAVSIQEPGRYRLLVSFSVHEVYTSTAADVGEDMVDGTVTFQVDVEGNDCEVLVTDGRKPVFGARVTASSDVSSLPPAWGLTDARGRWRLGRVRPFGLHLEVEAEGYAPWTGEVAEACRREGEVRVQL